MREEGGVGGLLKGNYSGTQTREKSSRYATAAMIYYLDSGHGMQSGGPIVSCPNLYQNLES